MENQKPREEPKRLVMEQSLSETIRLEDIVNKIHIEVKRMVNKVNTDPDRHYFKITLNKNTPQKDYLKKGNKEKIVFKDIKITFWKTEPRSNKDYFLEVAYHAPERYKIKRVPVKYNPLFDPRRPH
ncbi:MAG: hypothetical protein KKE23_04090 [Nanoarchaeota archaeon]|nr:hypothetical protein [Nanoarchaeota archaeon]